MSDTLSNLMPGASFLIKTAVDSKLRFPKCSVLPPLSRKPPIDRLYIFVFCICIWMLRRQIMHQLHGVERGEEKHLLSVESLATSEEKVLLVEMEFSRGVAREASWWRTYGRIRSSGKICCQSKIKGLSLVQLSPSVKEVQPCLHQAQKKGQCSKILCYQFSPRLFPSSYLSLFLAVLLLVLCLGPGLEPRWSALGPRRLPGPRGCYGNRTCE